MKVAMRRTVLIASHVVIAACVLVGCPGPVFGEITRLEVRSTREVSGGKSFGSVGPYEEVTGRLYFEVDPANRANRVVVDIEQARTNGNGRVEFSADVIIYRPRDGARA